MLASKQDLFLAMSACRLSLPSEVTHDTAIAVLEQLQRQLRLSGAVDVVEVDVAALRRFDSSVLAVLLALLRTAPQNDRKWRVLNSFPQFAGLVAIYGLDELLFS